MWQVRQQLFYSYCVWYCYLEEETVTDSVNTRELILGILMEVTKEGSYSHLVIRSVLDKYQYLEKKERAFITRVSEGTIQYMIELDYIINQFSKVKVNKMKPGHPQYSADECVSVEIYGFRAGLRSVQ